MPAGKKQVIMCMPTATPEENHSNEQQERDSKQYLIMEFNEQEFETKMSKMKSGEDGTESMMTEFNMYRAQLPSSPKKDANGKKKKSIYIPCGEDEVARVFGTNSTDEIMEFYYKSCCPK